MSAILKLRPVNYQAHMTFDLTDTEARAVSFSRQGRTYLPDSLRLAYSRSDNDPWQYEGGTMFGQVLKKDGTPSQNRNSELLWRHDSKTWPAWLHSAIADGVRLLS